MNKKIKVLLIVSLAANLFLAGVISGNIMKPRHYRGAQITRQHDEFAAARKFMQSRKGEQKALWNERRNLLEIIKEDNFDQAKFDAQVNKVGEMQTEMYKEFAGNMAERLRALPAEERNARIDHMLQMKKGDFSDRMPGDRKAKFKRDGERKFDKRRHNRPAPDASTSATPVETKVE